MIRKIKADLQKSKALQKTAKITLERLETTDMKKYPSNTLKDFYDAIHELLEALTLRDGIKIKGEGAHKELIDYIAKEYKLSDQHRIFLQQMRDYRNRISYEGFSVNPNYIISNIEQIRKIIHRLDSLLADRE